VSIDEHDNKIVLTTKNTDMAKKNIVRIKSRKTAMEYITKENPNAAFTLPEYWRIFAENKNANEDYIIIDGKTRISATYNEFKKHVQNSNIAEEIRLPANDGWGTDIHYLASDIVKCFNSFRKDLLEKLL